MAKSIQTIFLISLLCALGALCINADQFTDENETPNGPFLPEKDELFRFSRSAKGNQLSKIVQQQAVDQKEQTKQEQPVEVIQQPVAPVEQPIFSKGNQEEQQHQQQVNNVVARQQEEVTQVEQEQPQQVTVQAAPEPVAPASSLLTSSSSSSSKSSNAKSVKTITTTTTTTTTTKNGQDQPQVAQIKEIRIHTVPLSEAVHYANYVVVPSHGSKAAHLEESSSSSSHKSSSSSSSSETESIAPAVVVNQSPPAVVNPDCVLHRLIIERPVTSQVVVKTPSEISVSQSSSSSSRSSKIVSETVASPQPATVVVRRIVQPAPIITSRIVSLPANDGHLNEEHFHSETRSSRHESNGGLVSSSSSSSSSSSKSSSRSTTQQSAGLVAPPPPVQTVTVVRQAAPIVAYKAPLIAEVPQTKSNQYSVNVDHHYTGPNVRYGYSIKQQSQEPATRGVVVGERVVYL